MNLSPFFSLPFIAVPRVSNAFDSVRRRRRPYPFFQTPSPSSASLRRTASLPTVSLPAVPLGPTASRVFPHFSRRPFALRASMAKSKYDYVRQFESDDRCLPNVWMVVRIDGHNFHDFSERHEFSKPNDERALALMNVAARAVLDDFPAIFLAYGQSDEYSFVFRKDASTCGRRASKLLSLIVSLFTSHYVFRWRDFFPDRTLLYPPSFDSRVVCYPSEKNLRDYLAWRQVDCHINNLFNTTFWNLVLKSGMANRAAMERLKGTVSGDKNEILFTEFGINYNELPQLYRKGTVLHKSKVKVVEPEDVVVDGCSGDAGGKSHDEETKGENGGEEGRRGGGSGGGGGRGVADGKKPKKLTKRRQEKSTIFEIHESNRDIINDQFWDEVCPLSEFGKDRPLPARNLAVDKMVDFAKW